MKVRNTGLIGLLKREVVLFPSGGLWPQTYEHLLFRRSLMAVPTLVWNAVTPYRLGVWTVVVVLLALIAATILSMLGVTLGVTLDRFLAPPAGALSLLTVGLVFLPSLILRAARNRVRRIQIKARNHDFAVCVKCGYLLNGLGERGKCPECGYAFTREELRIAWERLDAQPGKESSG